MTKREFLEEMQDALVQDLSSGQVNGHIRYYSQYIDQETAKGLSEEDVIQKLGNPRLIAKTLVDTSAEDGNDTNSYGTYEQNKYSQGDYGTADGEWIRESNNRRFHTTREQKIHIALGILITIGIIALIISIISALLPVVLPVLAVLLLLSYLRKKL
ncbi:MAG: DUF1700 domain-containing protein [Blautia sp.]